MGITLDEAKKLDYREELYHTFYRSAKGQPAKFRVTGKPKVWKTMPERVEVPVTHGFHGPSLAITEKNLDDFCKTGWQALGTKIRFRKTEPNRYMVIFGKAKVPYQNKYTDRELGEVWKDSEGWVNDRQTCVFKTRKEAAEALCNMLMD